MSAAGRNLGATFPWIESFVGPLNVSGFTHIKIILVRGCRFGSYRNLLNLVTGEPLDCMPLDLDSARHGVKQAPFGAAHAQHPRSLAPALMTIFVIVRVIPQRVLLVEFAWSGDAFAAASFAILGCRRRPTPGALTMPCPPIIRWILTNKAGHHIKIILVRELPELDPLGGRERVR
jgi:hypothetical protein